MTKVKCEDLSAEMIDELSLAEIVDRIREFVHPQHEVVPRNRKYRFDVYVHMPEYDIRFEFVKKSKSLAVVLFMKDVADEAAYYKNLRCKTIEQAVDTAEYFYHRSKKTSMIDLIEALESNIKY